MITSVNAKINNEKYNALFEEASDILKGYKKCHYYKDGYNFYYKSSLEDGSTFVSLPDVNDAISFSEAYGEYNVLYRALTAEEKKLIDEDGLHAEGEKTEITSLEEYYSWIKTLGGFDIKYLRLPLDEEPFYINANTRAINIPSSFRSNGIAVQGDNLAETIYFTIDRYFDDKDLNDTDIWILWEAPQNRKGIVYDTLIKDVESEPGKIIFGWPIDKTITEIPGTLKFSVKFLDNKEGVLKYALSTLTANVNIKASLNINPDDQDVIEIDHLEEALLDRVNNSPIIGTQIAQEPEFIINLDSYIKDYYKDLHLVDLDTNTKDIFDVNLVDGVLNMGVQAKSADAGLIDYSWVYSKDNKNNGSAITSSYIYKEVNKADINDNQKYFYKNDNDNKYYLYNDIPSEAIITLYTRLSTCNADYAGYYWAVAKNRIQHSTKSKQSILCHIPFPTLPKIKTDVISSKVLGDTKKVEVKIEAPNTDTVTYNWQKENEDGNWIDLNIQTPEIEVESPGYYRVAVVNVRNNAESSAVISDICRVVEPAQAFEIEANGETIFDDTSLSSLNCPAISFKTIPESDSYIITWNKITDFVVENDISIPKEWKPLVSIESTVTKLEGLAFNPKEHLDKLTEMNEELTGDYLAIVTNKLGNEDNVKDSEPILFRVI